MDFVYELDGVTRATDDMHIQFTQPRGRHRVHARRVEGRRQDRRQQDDLRRRRSSYLQSVVTKGTPKLTIPSPSMVHYRGGRVRDRRQRLPRPRRVLGRSRASAYAEEVRRLYDVGCRYLQFDDTSLAYLNDPKQRAEMAREGRATPSTSTRSTSDHQHARSPNKPADMTVTTHMCRGNHQSSWVAEGGYDFVAEALFNDLEHRRVLHGVGRRALRRLRAAALRAQGQDDRARARHLQAPGAREQGRRSSGASRRPRSTSTSTSSACRRSAASRPPRRATPSRSSRRPPSCAS